MKKGSIDELEVTVKPIMTGRHALVIKLLDRVILQKDFEIKPGKHLENYACRCSISLIMNHFKLKLS